MSVPTSQTRTVTSHHEQSPRRRRAPRPGPVAGHAGNAMMVRPIVSSSWLAPRVDDDVIRIVDVRWYLDNPDRGRADYERAHLPGAIFLDLETELSGPTGPGRHPLPDFGWLASRLGELGIGDDHHVIAYDDNTGSIAARLWWMLRHVGHTAVSVLDGGFELWQASGFPTTDSIETLEPAAFTIRSVRDDTISRDELIGRLGEVALLDARAAPRFRGDIEPVDPEAGHIPTALSAPFDENLNPDGTFKSPEELARRFAAMGIEPDSDIVAYCGSGVTACHNILALHLAGLSEAMLYPGSWSDWSTAGFPVATGTRPG